MNTKPMTEKMNLYMQAKEAYYNGSPIMEDFEFDELEKELGLENKSYVGTKHNASYTVKHPFIMGSLSKIQIKKDNDGFINWSEYWTKLCKWITLGVKVVITPKFDGCSFEIKVNNHNIDDISTRGDGEYGRDIKKHLINMASDAIKNILLDDEFVLRGEVLIKKDIFEKKYSVNADPENGFVNPRSFVAGVLGHDYCEDTNFQEMLSDLSIVIYDVRINDEGNWIDNDWTVFKKDLYTGIGYIDDKYLPEHFIEDEDIEGPVDFENIYNEFSEYRIVCPYALDGIVIKPMMETRINNLVDERPKDCVAIKFVPMLEETEIVDIEWKIGKTGEWIPTIITKPVIMDGKEVKRASASNYGKLIKNKLSIGTKVILSLAGDIIPFIYKVTNTDNYSEDKLNLPFNTNVEGVHLMAILSEEERTKINFIESAASLNIPNLGPAETENIWNYISKESDETDDFFGTPEKIELPQHILMVSPETVYSAIINSVKSGTTKASKIKKSYIDIIKNINLQEIINSCNFRFCGSKVSEQCAKFMLLGPDKADFSHLAKEGYEWVFNGNSEEHKLINKIIGNLGKTIDDFKEIAHEMESQDSSNRIPVILTGEPNDYKSKGEFLKLNPQYVLTGSWKEVKIVFTNSLESNTGKMKKAKEKNIEIKLY